MNRIELQQLASDRILDAEALLAARRWSGAYYLGGYAVECGLKSCVLAYVERTGIIFQNRKTQVGALIYRGFGSAETEDIDAYFSSPWRARRVVPD